MRCFRSSKLQKQVTFRPMVGEFGIQAFKEPLQTLFWLVFFVAVSMLCHPFSLSVRCFRVSSSNQRDLSWSRWPRGIVLLVPCIFIWVGKRGGGYRGCDGSWVVGEWNFNSLKCQGGLDLTSRDIFTSNRNRSRSRRRRTVGSLEGVFLVFFFVWGGGLMDVLYMSHGKKKWFFMQMHLHIETNGIKIEKQFYQSLLPNIYQIG